MDKIEEKLIEQSLNRFMSTNEFHELLNTERAKYDFGYTEWFEESFKRGFSIGFRQGCIEVTVEIIRAMSHYGISLEDISRITDKRLEDVRYYLDLSLDSDYDT